MPESARSAFETSRAPILRVGSCVGSRLRACFLYLKRGGSAFGASDLSALTLGPHAFLSGSLLATHRSIGDGWIVFTSLQCPASRR